jgi:hypothetical protein
MLKKIKTDLEKINHKLLIHTYAVRLKTQIKIILAQYNYFEIKNNYNLVKFKKKICTWS